MNLVELLRDCPTGMELDCLVYDNITFDYVNSQQNRVYCKVGKSESVWFTPKGGVNLLPNAKCVIFPKGKTTWEGFVPPCQFKDGDIVVCTNYACTFVAIFKKIIHKTSFERYCLFFLDGADRFSAKNDFSDFTNPRFATEEEKQKLFDSIKENGYKWNAETKTLEKLIVPKFKVGDRIRLKSKPNYVYNIHSLTWDENNHLAYRLLPDNDKHLIVVGLHKQEDYELAPNKFDITTLKPFESRVLVRSTDSDIWLPSIYGFTDSDRYYAVGGFYWKQCIPYEVNKELIGTTNDCDDFYKTW